MTVMLLVEYGLGMDTDEKLWLIRSWRIYMLLNSWTNLASFIHWDSPLDDSLIYSNMSLSRSISKYHTVDCPLR